MFSENHPSHPKNESNPLFDDERFLSATRKRMVGTFATGCWVVATGIIMGLHQEPFAFVTGAAAIYTGYKTFQAQGVQEALTTKYQESANQTRAELDRMDETG